MIDSKLFYFLKTLKEEEVLAFEVFLSRNYGHRKVALVLFNYIKSFHPDYERLQELSTEDVHQALFKGKAYRKINVMNTLSDLFLWLKKFLLYQKLDESKLESNLLWFNVLKERKLKNETVRQISLLKEQAHQVRQEGLPFYLYKMLAHYMDHYEISRETPLNAPPIQDCIEHLDIFYAFIRIKLACEVTTRQNLSILQEQGDRLDIYKFDLPAAAIAPQVLKVNPLLHAYQEVYQLINNEDIVHYDNILKLIITHGSQIELPEKAVLFAYLQNYFASKIRRGEEEFSKQAHELNALAEDQGVFDATGFINPNQFTNIIAVACKVKAFSWAVALIEKYASRLDVKTWGSTLLLSRATLAFEQGDFDNTIAILSPTPLRNIQDSIRWKCLLLKSHYELSLLQANPDAHISFMIYFSKVFGQWLKRSKKLEANQKVAQAVRNFISILRELMDGKVDETALMETIKTANPVYFKEWLLEKAAQYTQKVHRS